MATGRRGRGIEITAFKLNCEQDEGRNGFHRGFWAPTWNGRSTFASVGSELLTRINYQPQKRNIGNNLGKRKIRKKKKVGGARVTHSLGSSLSRRASFMPFEIRSTQEAKGDEIRDMPQGGIKRNTGR